MCVCVFSHQIDMMLGRCWEEYPQQQTLGVVANKKTMCTLLTQELGPLGSNPKCITTSTHLLYLTPIHCSFLQLVLMTPKPSDKGAHPQVALDVSASAPEVVLVAPFR